MKAIVTSATRWSSESSNMVFNRSHPGERTFNHPADGRRNGPSFVAAGNCLNGDPKPLAGLGQALASVAEIAERWAWKPPSASARRTGTCPSCHVGPLARHRSRAGCIFVHRKMEFDAPDLLSTADTTIKTAQRRAAGSTIDDHDGWLENPRRRAASAAQPVQQPSPEAEPGPAGEQSIKRTEGDVARRPIAWALTL